MEKYDVVIRNGLIVDGTGRTAFKGSVGIKGDKIVDVGIFTEGKADITIDAKSRVIAPGFIDSHAHFDMGIFLHLLGENYLEQGITTCISGNCGYSLAPLKDFWLIQYFDYDALYEMQPYKYYCPQIVPLEEYKKKARELYDLDVDWVTFSDLLDRLDKTPLGPNLVLFVGHNNIRVAVMGEDQMRKPRDSELQEMKQQVASAMEVGAWGLSTGLDYFPGVLSKTEEIVELARVAAKHGGLYSTHWRISGARGEQAAPVNRVRGLTEAVRIGKEAGISVQLSHLQSAYKITPIPPPVLEEASAKATLEVIDKGLGEGVDVWFDVIPSTTFGLFAQSFLAALLSPWVREIGSIEGLGRALAMKDFRSELKEIAKADKWYSLSSRADPDWPARVKVTSSRNKFYVGKTIADLSEEKNKDPLDVLFDILQEDPETIAIFAGGVHILGETEIATYLGHTRALLGTDTLPADLKSEMKHFRKIFFRPHPNTYGGFPRYFRLYHRERGTLSLEEAVRKVTGLPAQRFGLKDRGLLASGMKADIVLFDPQEIADVGDRIEPRRRPRGISYVLVNGEIVVKDASHTGNASGVLIRKKLVEKR